MTQTTALPGVRLVAPPPPQWARLAAHVAAATPLASAVWRVALALGFSAGYTEQGLVALDLAGWGTAWVLALSVLSELAALLTLGLVSPWGEQVPRWVPILGGRRVHPLSATVPAVVGALLLTALWTPMLWWWHVPHDDMTPRGAALVGLVYLPLVAWGPLLGAVALSYYRRHRHR